MDIAGLAEQLSTNMTGVAKNAAKLEAKLLDTIANVARRSSGEVAAALKDVATQYTALAKENREGRAGIVTELSKSIGSLASTTLQQATIVEIEQSTNVRSGGVVQHFFGRGFVPGVPGLYKVTYQHAKEAGGKTYTSDGTAVSTSAISCVTPSVDVPKGAKGKWKMTAAVKERGATVGVTPSRSLETNWALQLPVLGAFADTKSKSSKSSCTVAIPFTIADPDGDINKIKFVTTTSNEKIAKPAEFAVSGSGGKRTLTFKRNSKCTLGSTDVVVTAVSTLGIKSLPKKFKLTVTPAADRFAKGFRIGAEYNNAAGWSR